MNGRDEGKRFSENVDAEIAAEKAAASSEARYRAHADRALSERVAEFAKSITSDDFSSREKESGEDEKRTRFLRGAGVDGGRAEWLARSYSGAVDTLMKSGDDSAVRAARDLGGARRSRRNIHKGHRQRLRSSAHADAELDAFSDVQILELLLSYFVPQRDTNPTAHLLLEKYGSLLEVMRAPSAELIKLRGMTATAASVIPMLSAICLYDGRREMKIYSHADAVQLFGSVYLGGRAGACVAYLDEFFALISVEKLDDDDGENLRAILSALCKYSAKYAIVATSGDMFPLSFDLASRANKLAHSLSLIGARLLDFLVFVHGGYYALDIGASDPEFLLVPLSTEFPSDFVRRLGKDK